MRKTAIQLLMSTAAVCTLATGLYAQSYAIRAHVPFAFTVGNQVLGPGDYTIAKRLPFDVPVMSPQSGTSVMLRAGGMYLEGKGPARLVFHTYGNHTYLAEVWDGSGRGTQVPASKAEKAEQERAGLNTEQSLVVLASAR